MKKVFAVILSVIILVLSAVPCNDENDRVAQQNQTVMLNIAHSPDITFDICNPFFFCHTGHSTFVQSEVSFMAFISSPVRLVSENPVFSDITIYHLFWRPPEA